MSIVDIYPKFLMDHVKKEAKNDKLKRSDRIGQLVGMCVAVAVIIYFLLHQANSTGFFTVKFGALEAALLYISALYGVIPSILRFFWGTKNKVRPFDMAGNFIFLIAAGYLLAVWPFDFPHFLDLFPAAFGNAFSWFFSNGLIQTLLSIGMAFLVLFTAFELLTYLGVKKELENPPVAPEPAPVPEVKEEVKPPI